MKPLRASDATGCRKWAASVGAYPPEIAVRRGCSRSPSRAKSNYRATWIPAKIPADSAGCGRGRMAPRSELTRRYAVHIVRPLGGPTGSQSTIRIPCCHDVAGPQPRTSHRALGWVHGRSASAWRGSAGLVGSILRGQAKADSDVDLLVQFAPGAKSYGRFFALSELLEAHLGRPVELVTLEALSPFIGPRILAEAQDVLRAA